MFNFFRCLCDLAKQIGFSTKALDIFQLEKILGMFKHVVSKNNSAGQISWLVFSSQILTSTDKELVIHIFFQQTAKLNFFQKAV